MFGVLTIERKKPDSLWEGLALRLSSRAAIESGTDSVRLAMFLKVALTLPEGAGPRLVQKRLRKCMELMRLRGVHRAVVPEEARAAAEAACIAPVETRSALQACAAEAALLALDAIGADPARSGVTLIAERTGRDVQGAAFSLAGRVRCVRVCSRVPAPHLRRRLYEDFGIAEQAPLADSGTAALVFDPAGELLDGYGVVCNLTGQALEPHGRPECRYQLLCPPAVMAQKPPLADTAQFVAALYLCGGLGLDDLELCVDPESALDREGQPQYNKD